MIRKGNSGAADSAGLTLGAVQASGIVGNLTDPFNRVPFTLYTESGDAGVEPGAGRRR